MVRSLVFAGSTASEFREFLLYFQESLASLHISEMRSAGPRGPSVIGQVRDKSPAFLQEHLLLAGHRHLQKSGTQSCLPVRLLPVSMLLLLAQLSTGLQGQGYSSTYRHPGHVLLFSPSLTYCVSQICAKAQPWIRFPASAVECPPRLNIGASC